MTLDCFWFQILAAEDDANHVMFVREAWKELNLDCVPRVTKDNAFIERLGDLDDFRGRATGLGKNDCAGQREDEREKT